MGHSNLGRDYGRAGAGLVLAPALDFTVDAWSQSRVQLMRGVESGFSVACGTPGLPHPQRPGGTGHRPVLDRDGHAVHQRQWNRAHAHLRHSLCPLG